MHGEENRLLFPGGKRPLCGPGGVFGVALGSPLIAVGGWAINPLLSASVPGVAVRNCLKVLACYARQQVPGGVWHPAGAGCRDRRPCRNRGVAGAGGPTQTAPAKVTDIRQDLPGLTACPVCLRRD